MISLNAFFAIHWQDQFRIWNDTYPLACLTELTLNYEKAMVWTPDIVLWNANIIFFMSASYGPQTLRLESDGRVTLYPGGEFTFFCPFDLTYFPFDIQQCNVLLVSWTSDVTEQHLNPNNDGTSIFDTANNEQWEIIDTEAKPLLDKFNSGRSYAKILFTITLARKPGYYMMNIFLPSITISLVEAVTFMVPADREDRLAMSFTALLAYSMFQTLIYNEVPKSAEHPPLLTIYLSLMSFYIFVAIAMQGFIIHLINSKTCFRTVQRFVFYHRCHDKGKTKLSNEDCEIIELRKHSRLVSILNQSAILVYLFLLIVTPLAAFAIVPLYKQ